MSSNTQLKYKGNIIYIGSTEVVSDKFSKRQIVLSDKTSQYPQEICFEVHKDKCAILDSYNVGDEVDAEFNLSGRLWKDNKWCNTLVIWKINKVGSNNNVVTQQPNPQSNLGAVNVIDDLSF
jgi:hypothetical protein